MSRPARIISSTGMYHIMFRGMNRQGIFEEDKDYEKMLEVIQKVKEEKKFEIYAYCFMTNHVHLFIKEKESGDIKKIMHKILSIYVGWFNFKYKRSGSLIGNRYKSEPIEDETYYLSLIRYIHQNPTKAKICGSLDTYKWSSYLEYVDEKNAEEKLTDTEFIFSLLGGARQDAIKEFLLFHNDFSEEDFEISEKIKLSDAELRRKMLRILRVEKAPDFVSLEREERNQHIVKLLRGGFSIREVERLTGVSRGIIQRVPMT